MTALAWYLNRYVCPDCKEVWDDAWSAMSDDTCPSCESEDISPVSSDDLSVIVERNEDGDYEVLVSSDAAHEEPKYLVLLTLSSRFIEKAAAE